MLWEQICLGPQSTLYLPPVLSMKMSQEQHPKGAGEKGGMAGLFATCLPCRDLLSLGRMPSRCEF